MSLVAASNSEDGAMPAPPEQAAASIQHVTGAAVAGSKPRRLYGLQFLRAAAALAVLFIHAFEPLPFPYNVLGVVFDLFFLLSGFLVVAITDERTRPWAFFKARLARIVPIYWLLSLGVILFIATGFTVRRQLGLGDWEKVGATFAFIPWDNGNGKPFPMIPAGWTLNIEMLCYVVFALTLFLRRRWQLPALTAAIGLLVAVGVIFRFDSLTFKVWTNPIMLEFVVGAWIGWAWQGERRLLPVFLIIALLWIPATPLGSQNLGVQQSLLNVVAFIPVLAIFFLVVHLERRPGGVPDWPPARILGDASYSIYLFHFFPMLAFRSIEVHFGTPHWVFSVGVFVTGLLGGLVVHYAIERPLLVMFGRRRRYKKGVPIPGGL